MNLLMHNTLALDASAASVYLAGRVRTLTPRGATEYLEMERPDWNERVEAGLTIINCYREIFPEEFGNSTRPPFSTERETEFYHLISQHKFPIDLTPLYQYSNWIYGWIPIKLVQKHDWIEGCGCDFEQLEHVFQLVIALTNHEGEHDLWPQFAHMYGIPREPRPADHRGDAQLFESFVVRCSREPGLRALSSVFGMFSYSTGNLFLDAHPSSLDWQRNAWDWNARNVEALAAHWKQGKRLLLDVAALNEWLKQSPTQRIGRAIALWNEAAK